MRLPVRGRSTTALNKYEVAGARRSTTAAHNDHADAVPLFAKQRRSEAGDIREKGHRVGVIAP
jgi:hypothetical protein